MVLLKSKVSLPRVVLRIILSLICTPRRREKQKEPEINLWHFGFKNILNMYSKYNQCIFLYIHCIINSISSLPMHQYHPCFCHGAPMKCLRGCYKDQWWLDTRLVLPYNACSGWTELSNAPQHRFLLLGMCQLAAFTCGHLLALEDHQVSADPRWSPSSSSSNICLGMCPW